MIEPSKPLAMMTAAELEFLLERVITAKLDAQPVPEPVDELPELMSRAQAAAYLGVSKGSVDNYARAGMLKRHFIGKLPRFRREELRQVFDSWKK